MVSKHWRHFRRKQTVIHLPTPPENVTTLNSELQKLFHLTEGLLRSFKMLEALKRASSGLSSVALKRTGCDVWQLECQASNGKVFRVTTFCTDTCFQSFLTLISRTVHHSVLKFSPCRNKPLPHHVHINTRAPPAECPRRSTRAMQTIGSTKQQ